MKKYNIIELNIQNKNLLNIDKKSLNEKEALKTNNVIYIYSNSKSKKIYIGQTINFIKRHKQHYNGNEEKFNKANFNRVIIICSEYFNKSALDDVEAQLITYFLADSNKINNIKFDNEVINRTIGNSVNKYKERKNVFLEVILPLWNDYLFENHYVNSKFDNLKTKVLVKYSPIKELTKEQFNLIEEIKNNPLKSYVINGDAGTGKTVLLTHLAAYLFDSNPNIKIGIIVQPNWEKIGSDIFKIYGMNSSRLQVSTSTKFIKKDEKYDVIIVDESHKLSRKGNKQMSSFNSVYKGKYKNYNTHLEIIQKLGTQIILMYDIFQVIRPANISRDIFKELTKNYEKRTLNTQFRIQPLENKSYTSDDYINGIKYLLYKDTGLLESEYTNFNPNFNRDVFKDKSKDAYFGYFEDKPLYNLFKWKQEDKNFNPEHINRILSGLVEPWKQSDGKDPTITHFCENNIKKRWNSTQENWINIKDEDAEEQIGSVFAVQGIDLNKIGVLIGADLKVYNNRLIGDQSKFFNVNGVFSKDEMKKKEYQYEFTLFVLNIYYILLTRGIDGIRIGFWKNNDFKKYMEETLDINHN